MVRFITTIPVLRKVCESLRHGIAAFIGGTNDEDIENVVRSMSARTQIPFIETHWKTFHRPPDQYAVNLYPDPSLLSEASTFDGYRVNARVTRRHGFTETLPVFN